MADAAATPTEAPAKPSLGKRLGKLVGLAFLCIGALLGGLIASMGLDGAKSMLGMGSTAEMHEMEAGTEQAEASTAAPPPADNLNITVTPFKEIIVNVSATTTTGRKTTRFLKLNVALAYDVTLPGGAQIEDRKLFLRDSFQDYLRQLDESDLQGSLGLSRLKAELLRRSRAIAGGSAPQEIVISDLIVQ